LRDGDAERLGQHQKARWASLHLPSCGSVGAPVLQYYPLRHIAANIAKLPELLRKEWSRVHRPLGINPGTPVLAWAVQRGTAFLTTSVTPARIQENFELSRTQNMLRVHAVNQLCSAFKKPTVNDARESVTGFTIPPLPDNACCSRPTQCSRPSVSLAPNASRISN
jgi:diketogulonate reductase-like aldo/keto reductase